VTYETYALIQARCDRSFVGFADTEKELLASTLLTNWHACTINTIVIVLRLLMPKETYLSNPIKTIIWMTNRGNLKRDLQRLVNPQSVTRLPTAQMIQGSDLRAILAASDTVGDTATIENWVELWPRKTGERGCRFSVYVIRQILKNLLAKLPPSNAPIADHRDRLEEVYVEIQKKRELASASASGTSS